MKYTAKSTIPAPTNQQYELFVTDEVTDVEGVKRIIPKSIGCYSIEQLEKQIADCQKTILECQDKIKAIAALNEQTKK